MFLRREKLRLGSRVGGFFWPRIGWTRTAAYYRHRLHRMPGTSRNIAAGLALGVALGMTPFYGLHIVIAVALASLLSVNLFAAAIGTLVSNPWTAPPLWLATYYVGVEMLGQGGASKRPDFIHMFMEMTEAALSLNLETFAETIWPVLWPMIVGSLPFAAVAGLVTYFGVEPVIRTMRVQRALRRAMAIQRRGES